MLLLAAGASPAVAVERIRFEAAEITFGNFAMEGVDAVLAMRAPERAALALNADRARLPEGFARQTGPMELLQLRCEDLVIREPRIACRTLSMTVAARLLPPIAFDGRFEMLTDRGRLRLVGEGPVLAGHRLGMDITREDRVTNVLLRLPETPLATLVPFFAPWAQLPDSGLYGAASLEVDYVVGRGRNHAAVDARFSEVGFQNEAATWIGEKLGFELHAAIDLAQEPLAWQARVTGEDGQFLGGPVLLDLARNALAVEARGHFDGQLLAIEQFESHQQDLAIARGDALLQIAPMSVRHARIELETLQFPDAYTSYLQLALATTPFNQLTTSGRLSGALTVTDNAPVNIDLLIGDLAFSDDSRNLQVTGVDADVHWTAGEVGPPRPSWLKWESARGWNIEGARSRVDFVTNDRNFQLLREARLPVFDGALVIQRLAVEHLGTPQMAGEFAAVIEPISMQPVSRALGLPEFSGTLSGTIPGLRYRDQVLELEGEIEAQVFEGLIVARNLRVGEPFGRFPRMYADLTARRLDLQTLTEVFDFGDISGRIDVDMTGLETFGWRPTAFDFSFRNTPGDRTKRRISQRAVQNLSSIGGGGGGVAAALQSGALRFFDTFVYDEIGLSCRLRNDVCTMGGVGPARGGGFFIVRGRGLPHINIIGNGNRVDWPRLVSQVGHAIRNAGDIVVN